jgi:hypothetical protein
MESLSRPDEHLDRRRLLQLGGLGLASLLSRAARLEGAPLQADRGERASSLILVWLDGGPSQLETFDPKPGSSIAAGSRARRTRLAGLAFAEGLEQLADVADRLTVVRSLTSREGDHERGRYAAMTGYRPEPTLRHPSLGALLRHEREAPGLEIPGHVSFLSNGHAAWGGYLGARYDAFQAGDPSEPLADVSTPLSDARYARRLDDLAILERGFAKGRERAAAATGHHQAVNRARRMMRSKQLAAFDLSGEPEALRRAYGDSAFGRSCLAARRLVEVGVPCVEVRLGGWDSHLNNHEIQARLVATLDPGLATLIRDLEARERLRDTVVLCLGEFGRTPKMNALGGRDHWPHGFSAVIAGGPFARGRVVGETDPKGGREVKDPHSIQDLAASLISAFGVDPQKELMTPIQRPVKLSEGRPVPALFASS